MSLKHLHPVHRLVRFHGAARYFSISTALNSGHSRWSKIKHDKGKADARKGDVRADVARQIARSSKDGGPDPAFNPHLPGLIAIAKRSGMPKTAIEAAIARGQGVSASGQALEAFNVEFLFPESNIAGILECQTDNKKRLMMNVGDSLKRAGATMTAVAFMFTRRGKIIFQKQDALDEETILDQAIEAGASDVNFEENEVVLFTEVQELATVADAMARSLEAKPKSQDLIWVPNSDMVVDGSKITPESQAQLDKLYDKLAEMGEDQSIQETYLNIG
ncbi:MAG: hypothetical protein GOMPHAMPRED_007795 [Gomphillus americanus]|uniref:Uncharacterized protein n=1 Tax=Gomphillus americanus TaxID=1940652 RepID=A0A8H3EWD2_9LECA|nr:MAG: hypothetical protein GOMPHAMPRED_007795 [Gomphillus americanus]